MAFDAQLMELRDVYSLSQEDVARIIGVSRTTVGDIERGKRDIELSELQALAQYLQLDATSLIQRSARQPASTLGKYREIIMQVAKRYGEATGKDIPKTFLAKLVYLADFAWFYKNLEPMSGVTYYRREHGPVADEYYMALGLLVDEGSMSTQKGKQAHWYRPHYKEEQPFVPQNLSVQEIELINAVVDKWKDASTQEIVEFTHSQLPWQICFPNEAIPYSLITQEELEHVY